MKRTATSVEVHDRIPAPHERPLICLFDAEDSVYKVLSLKQFKCLTGTLGSCVKVPNQRKHDEHFLHLNYKSPENLHECAIVIFDMTHEECVDYSNENLNLEKAKDKNLHVLLSRFPQKIFDPRPLATNIICQEIDQILQKESVIITFLGREEIAHYEYVEIGPHETRLTGEETRSNFRFYNDFPRHKSKSGKRVCLPREETRFSTLLGRYVHKSRYNSIFFHPTVWKDGENQNDERFSPLLENDNGEIISYCHVVNKGMVIVFPQIEDKTSFLSELLNIYLPDIVPTLFPFHGQFGWLESGEYLLPNESELYGRKKEIEAQYKLDLESVEKQIQENKTEYKFLHELLYQTGAELVKAIEHFLGWLEFESVTNMDETQPDVREEDLQVETEEGLLVIEVKGIGGTSTDKDCSQISKIKFRRAEQRNKFDVSALYIVNHQRYMPPNNRANPPFTENQIGDAAFDKRGLLTTFDLYKAYFMIQDGILTKKQVRDYLFQPGLVLLEPRNLTSIGVPTEFYREGQVAIVTINGTLIQKGGSIIIKKNAILTKAKLISIQVEGIDVEEVKSGEVGLMLNTAIKRGSELFVEQV